MKVILDTYKFLALPLLPYHMLPNTSDKNPQIAVLQYA